LFPYLLPSTTPWSYTPSSSSHVPPVVIRKKVKAKLVDSLKLYCIRIQKISAESFHPKEGGSQVKELLHMNFRVLIQPWSDSIVN